jgi:hypothetical protein
MKKRKKLLKKSMVLKVIVSMLKMKMVTIKRAERTERMITIVKKIKKRGKWTMGVK